MALAPKVEEKEDQIVLAPKEEEEDQLVLAPKEKEEEDQMVQDPK